MTKKDLDELTYKIIGAAIEVHKSLGPGLLESVYHKCLKHEFFVRDLSFVSEFLVPIRYKAVEVEADLQLLTYMKLLEKPKGILINFYCTNLFKEGQRIFVNEYFRNLPEG